MVHLQENAKSMRLFFETSGQGIAFLAAIPVGFLLAACLDCAKGKPLLRAVLDIAVLMLSGFVLLLLTVLLSEEKLRIYHLLGLVIGAFLYLKGAGEVKRMIAAFYLRKKQKIEGVSGLDGE